MDDIDIQFNKKFSFSKYVLPSCTGENIYNEEKWTDPHLDKLKTELNDTKSLLNDKDVYNWRKHTDFTNRAGYILDTIKSCYKVRLLTQAWCKFFEILNSYTLIDTQFFRSLHLCEAPGAFINALEFHLEKKKLACTWQWIGNTLNPHYEGHSMSTAVFDDRFILPTLDCWNFGPDNTGDIKAPGFLDSLVEEVQANGPFHLATADGSMDCQNRPDQQETLVAELHFAEVALALHCLAPGGHLVVKKFTLLECDSICLTFLLACLFHKVNVFKPVTSKPGNSEVYVICQGFRATEATPILPILRQNLRGNSRALFSRCCIPEEFLKELRSCGETFVGFQRKAIKENLKLFGTDDLGWLESVKSACVRRYFQLCDLSLPHRLPSKLTDRSRMALHPGSYNARLETSSLGLVRSNFLDYFSEFLQNIDDSPSSWHHLRLQDPVQQPCPEWVLTGRPPDSILSSKFCCPRLLYLWSQVQESKVTLEPAGGTLLDLHPLVQHETKELVILQGTSKDEKQSELRPKVFVVVLPSTEEHTEDFKQVLLHRVFTILQESHPGDSAFVCLPSVLSRFTVGLMFLLGVSYQKVRVWADNQSGRFQTWQLEHFSRPMAGTLTFLDFLRGLPELRPVLEVVPIQYLSKYACKVFYPFLFSVNRQQFVNRVWTALQQHSTQV